MEYEGRKYSYSVVPYAREWPEIYEREAALVQRVVAGDLLYIEHVGGTAVAGLASRPIVDIAATVRDLGRIDFHHMAFRAAGYEPINDLTIPHARRFRKDLVAHLYIFPEEHPRMTAMLDHRDYLRAHPDEVERLADAKRRLFKKYPRDYAAYREHRETLFKELSQKAARWRGREAEDDCGTV